MNKKIKIFYKLSVLNSKDIIYAHKIHIYAICTHIRLATRKEITDLEGFDTFGERQFEVKIRKRTRK